MSIAQPRTVSLIGSTINATIVTSADGSQHMEWDDYVERHPDATCDHLWHWRSLIREVFGHDCSYLIARRANRIVGVLPLVCFNSRIFGRFVVSLPFLNYGGLLVSDAEAASALVDRARKVAVRFGASHMELRHTARRFNNLPCRQHKLALRLALPATTEALWDTLNRKIRNQVRKAQKADLTTGIGGSELVDDFYSVFARNMHDLGTPVYPKALFVQVLKRFANRAKVHVVRHGSATVAAAISIRFRDTVLVPWASSLREHRDLCPNMLLYWSMLENAVEQGAQTFDFGRSSPDGGTHQFKKQWGAQETPMYWEYVLLSRAEAPDQGTSNPRFARAANLWRRLPLWAANKLGPKIIRNIP